MGRGAEGPFRPVQAACWLCFAVWHGWGRLVPQARSSIEPLGCPEGAQRLEQMKTRAVLEALAA
jgi:hypothetical protein